MASSKVAHIHTYERPRWNKKIYRCIAPDCPHYIQKKLLLGKYGQCPECGNQFILDREKLLRAKPKCDFCSDTKKSRTLKQIASAVEENKELQDLFETIVIPTESEDKL